MKNVTNDQEPKARLVDVIQESFAVAHLDEYQKMVPCGKR